MPVHFCRHLVGKNSEKCLSLWYRLHTYASLVSQWSYGHFLKLTDSVRLYLNNTINICNLTQRIISCYTHKMAIVSWPQILWRHFTLRIQYYTLWVIRCHLLTRGWYTAAYNAPPIGCSTIHPSANRLLDRLTSGYESSHDLKMYAEAAHFDPADAWQRIATGFADHRHRLADEALVSRRRTRLEVRQTCSVSRTHAHTHTHQQMTGNSTENSARKVI